MITIKSQREIELMREAGRIVAETLALLEKTVKPGMTTLELDQIADSYIRGKGAIPSFKNYNGFTGSICTSLNEVVVHGIPSADMVIKDGDILSIDVGAILDGYHGDAARTIPCGKVSEKALALIEVTKDSFFAGMAQAVVGNRLSDISHAIQTYAESFGYGVVRDFCGHGIGRQMHEPPQIPNYGRPGHGPRLQAGMCLAVEPMINEGTYEVVVLPDQWTTVTKDGKLSSHYENTLVITDGEPIILTAQ